MDFHACTALNALLVLCGIWSLDFFQFVIPPFCVSRNVKTLALEYVVAFYPVCLILVTFVFIKLHDNNFRLIVWVWRPFHRHFVHFRRRWDSKASIINTFCFTLVKNFFPSFSLLLNSCNSHISRSVFVLWSNSRTLYKKRTSYSGL